MNGQIADLANVMRTKKAGGEKFVLMLGAGASMSSGVPSTPVIMEELLRDYGTGIPAGPVESRFDDLWKRSTREDRRAFLRPYLELTPSPGYLRLARLVRAGYFDVIITFNFDRLLERALQELELEFRTIIRGETIDDEMLRLIEGDKPRVKVAKLHGSLDSTDHFLFAAEEMHEYPDPIAQMLRRITESNVIICGYAFNDNCVINSFARQGGSVVTVDPNGIPTKLRYFTGQRHSNDWAIRERFDTFFESLHAALLPAAPRPVDNPFKFLESYEFEDADMLIGREKETARFVKQMQLPVPPAVLVIGGRGKSGKTSLAKAALIPALGVLQQRPVYLRSRKDLETSLPRDIAAILTEPGKPAVPPAADIASALRQLVAATPGRVVVLLDQFDRVINEFDIDTPDGEARLIRLFTQQIFPAQDDRLTVVLLVTDEGSLAGKLFEICMDRGVGSFPMQCEPFTKDEVVGIIGALAAKAGVELDPFIVNDLATRYHSTRNSAPDKRFTLAHVQAVCHLLVSSHGADIEVYKTFDRNIEALHQAINVCDMISFVEDFAWADAEQLRNLIKVPLLESKERIALFVKLHYEELLARAAAQRRRNAAGPRT